MSAALATFGLALSAQLWALTQWSESRQRDQDGDRPEREV